MLMHSSWHYRLTSVYEIINNLLSYPPSFLPLLSCRLSQAAIFLGGRKYFTAFVCLIVILFQFFFIIKKRGEMKYMGEKISLYMEIVSILINIMLLFFLKFGRNFKFLPLENLVISFFVFEFLSCSQEEIFWIIAFFKKISFGEIKFYWF